MDLEQVKQIWKYAIYKKERENQQKNLLQLAASSNNGSAIQQSAESAKNAELEKFNIPNEYPVGIDLAEALKNPGCDEDMVLREGDYFLCR